MRAILPVRLAAGRGWQASPVGSNAVTETSGAVIGFAEFAPDPGTAIAVAPPAMIAYAEKTRSFLAAPTVIAEGDVPGESMVSGFGPSLPATITTITPRRAARSIA